MVAAVLNEIHPVAWLAVNLQLGTFAPTATAVSRFRMSTKKRATPGVYDDLPTHFAYAEARVLMRLQSRRKPTTPAPMVERKSPNLHRNDETFQRP